MEGWKDGRMERPDETQGYNPLCKDVVLDSSVS
jgi:hypothetical protein